MNKLNFKQSASMKRYHLFPRILAFKVIESLLSVCPSIWVCETYVVHHGAQGGPMSMRSGGSVNVQPRWRNMCVLSQNHTNAPYIDDMLKKTFMMSYL